MGRSLTELMTHSSPLMPPVEVFDSDLLQIEAALRPSVPDEIRKRITTSRNLAVYGAFSYDFFAVSAFWSLTCVEMALWEKFTELHPGPIIVKDPKGNIETITANHLASHLQGRFRINGMPRFNGSFRSLVDWAAEQQLVEDPKMLARMVKLRNSFAHPKEFNTLWNPAMAVTVFQATVEVLNYLWPLVGPRL